MISRTIRFVGHMALTLVITAVLVFGGLLVLTNDSLTLADTAHDTEYGGHHTNYENVYFSIFSYSGPERSHSLEGYGHHTNYENVYFSYPLYVP